MALSAERGTIKITNVAHPHGSLENAGKEGHQRRRGIYAMPRDWRDGSEHKHAAVAKQLEMPSLGSGEKENADNGHGVY
jgi:hypothetical protein